MKNMIRFTPRRGVQLGAALVCAGFLNTSLLQAGDAKAITPAEEEPFLNNWINMSLGGLITSGNKAQFQQQNPTAGPMFGGLDDMHLEKSIGKAQMVLDAHAIFPNSDYKVKLDISLPDVGYIRGGYTEFCTYSNGNGGYLPPNENQAGGLFFPGPEYALYRGLAWVELGLRVPNFPELTLRYEHAFRSGQEDSTSWGGTQSSAAQSWGPVAGVNNSPFYQNKPVNPQTGLVGTASNSSVRKIVPSFRNINEQRDTFTFDAKYLFGKPESLGNTEVNVGMRYEFINNSDSLNWQNAPGGQPTVLGTATSFNVLNVPQVPTNYYVTQSDNQKAANYSGHASTVTRFGDKLWLTVGYGYSAVSSTISGSRVAGSDFGVPYSAYNKNLAYAGLTSGYIDMGGNAQVGQSVTTVNLLWMPIDGLSITPAARFESSNTIATSNRLTEIAQAVNPTAVQLTPQVKRGSTVLRAATFAYGLVSPATAVNVPTIVNSAVALNEFNQSLDIRYSGIPNWVFYAKGEWTEAYEDRQDSTPNNTFNGKTQFWPPAGTPTAINNANPAVIFSSPTLYNFNGSNANITQKYTMGANWYPLRQLNMAIQYYTEFQKISQTIYSDDPTKVNPTTFFGSKYVSGGWKGPGSQYSAAGNQRLLEQFWATNDINFRVTWQPFYNLSIVTRYDFQQIKIDSQWAHYNSLEGNGALPYGQSGFMINSILSESVTWNPVDRLYVQGSFSYVVNTLSSPASSLTPAVTNSQNNYWTASAGLGYALDNKTQVHLDGSYYCANNYTNNSQYGVPYGAGASEFDLTATVSRQITRNVGVSFTYFYNYYNDVLSGGNNSYTAQTVAASMQVKF